MSSKFKRKLKRTLKRWMRNRTFVLAASAIILVTGAMLYASYMDNKRNTVNPATYTPLLQLIARAESNGNYNAYFGNPGNTSINFTQMSIGEVLAWQANFVQQGNASSAVGRYQIVNTTLSGLVRQLGLDVKQKFDQSMQDKLAITLLERRGAEAYVNKELARDQFAANLAKEWAALPKVIGENPGHSYYAGDGLNQSRVGVDEIMQAIEPIGP